MGFQELSNMFQNEGIPESVVDKILNEKYQEFDNAEDLKYIYGQAGNYQDILQYLADGYLIEDLSGLGVRQENIQMFLDYLKANNLTVENAKAINQYSNGSNMILSLRRGTASREDIKAGIMSDLTIGLEEKRYSRFRTNKSFCTRVRLLKTFVRKLSIF